MKAYLNQHRDRYFMNAHLKTLVGVGVRLPHPHFFATMDNACKPIINNTTLVPCVTLSQSILIRTSDCRTNMQNTKQGCI